MQKIVVKRFMALTGETTIDIKNMLVIIGEQASGKSTLAKLIYFFRTLRQDFLYTVYDNLDTQENIPPAFLKSIRDKFYNFFGSTRHLDDFEITFYYSQVKFIRLSLYPDKGLKVFLGGRLNDTLFSDIKQHIRAMNNVASRKDAYELLAFQEAVNRTEDFIAAFFQDRSQPLFIPAGRNITVSYPDQFKLNFYRGLKNDLNETIDSSNSHPPSTDLYLMTAFINHVEKMTEKFAGYDFQGVVDEYISRKNAVNQDAVDLAIKKIHKILRGEYKNDHNGEKIFFNDENFVLLNKASSGQQEIIRILQDIFIIILNEQKAFRVIEEPEAHLYPLAQKQVIEMIALMLNSTNSEIVITTHSPYVLSILNNLLFAMRVAQKSASTAIEAAKILEPFFWLDPNKCAVYAIKDGECISIFDMNTGLIEQNYLDEISEELGADFDGLYDIYGSTTVK